MINAIISITSLIIIYFFYILMFILTYPIYILSIILIRLGLYKIGGIINNIREQLDDEICYYSGEVYKWSTSKNK
jgi:hypothetical protein